MTDYRAFYRNRRVMITGGLGFIGSALAHQLAALGAKVLIVDSLIPDSGGNFAKAAAKALVDHSNLTATEIVRTALEIAADICVYSNRNIVIEELSAS